MRFFLFITFEGFCFCCMAYHLEMVSDNERMTQFKKGINKMSQKLKKETHISKNMAEIAMNPLLLLPFSVVATLVVNYIIGSMEPIKAISIAIIILIFALIFAYIANILFYQFLKLNNINHIGNYKFIQKQLSFVLRL